MQDKNEISTSLISRKAAMSEKTLTLEEEVEAIKGWQERADPKALDKLIRSHARIAYSFAARWTKNEEHINDLAASGMMGLMKAADKFDLSKGVRFATYSRWWVMTGINTDLPKVLAAVTIPTRTYIEARKGKGKNGGAEAERAHQAVFGSVELDAPVGDEGEGGASVIDFLECSDLTPEEEAVKNSDATYRQALLAECMKELSEREQDVIIRRKLSSDPETLESLSQRMNVTRERVRQIESRAMNRLKRLMLARGFNISMLRE